MPVCAEEGMLVTRGMRGLHEAVETFDGCLNRVRRVVVVKHPHGHILTRRDVAGRFTFAMKDDELDLAFLRRFCKVFAPG